MPPSGDKSGDRRPPLDRIARPVGPAQERDVVRGLGLARCYSGLRLDIPRCDNLQSYVLNTVSESAPSALPFYLLGSLGLPSWATNRSCMSLACSSSFARSASIMPRVVGSLSPKYRTSSR